MKKIKIAGVAVLSIVLLTAALAGPVFASEDATEEITGTTETVQVEDTDVTDIVESYQVEQSGSETKEETVATDDDIIYTTGGSAVGREDEGLISTESAASIMAVRDYIVPTFASLYVGQSEKLELLSGVTSNLTWTSSNNSVVTVDAGGKITGVSKGFAVVRATDVSGNYDAVKVFVGYYVGADLDSYQGTLDAEDLVNSGIDFAIIRRGYGNLEFTNQLDKQFERTYGILKNAGIPVGTYLFNYFESTANAIEEANNLYPYIKDLDFELGVYSDFEEGGAYSSYEYYKSVNGRYPTPAEITEMNTAFLETLKSKLDEETPVGYYSSMNQCINWYSDDFLDTYPLWAAYWRYRTNDANEDGGSTYSVLLDKVNEYFQGYSYLTYNMVMHQYSSEEFAYRVGGNDGWLDVDVIDMDSPLALRFVEIKAAVKSVDTTTTISWAKPNGANNIDGYIVYKTESGVTRELARVDADVLSYAESNSRVGAQYYVKAYASCGDTVYYSQGGGAIEKVFSDVSVNDWFYDDVMYVYANGIMTGMGGTDRFAPNENLSRAQFVVTLWRMSGSPSIAYKRIFPDVPQGEWYTDAVLWAYGNKIISGYESGYFGTADPITREQLCTMLYRYAKWQGMDVSARADLSKFTDNSKISSWARDALSWCVAKGIINGEGNGKIVNPTGNALRCGCAAIIRRFLVEKNTLLG